MASLSVLSSDFMDFLDEIESKRGHDPMAGATSRCVWVPGAIVVGAGPSGLATAACLKQHGVSSLILEKENCIGSLWKLRTYDRLLLHLPKQFCQLPLFPFPANYPTYPTKQQFIAYIEAYANNFDLQPVFNTRVIHSEFDPVSGFWIVKAKIMNQQIVRYFSRWLIIAAGENAEEVTPFIDGLETFQGPVMHTSAYKSGDIFRGKGVLVIGCGNSGMEVCLDLCNYEAHPSLVVRDTVHVLPQEILGSSTFGLSMFLLRWLPVRMVDRILLLLSCVVLGDTCRIGLIRPKIGPMELKKATGRTPVLDVGTLSKIRQGDIKVRRGIKRVNNREVEFVEGKTEEYDAIILATGYKSSVPTWLKLGEEEEKDGFLRKQIREGWKGENGLYGVGLSSGGLVGSSIDAQRIAADIASQMAMLQC